MAGERILVVEDDKNIAKLVRYNLEKEGFKVITARTGEEAFGFLDKEKIDLITLDIMLPEMDGFEICREIKKNEKLAGIPIIMLTAKGEEVDRVVGLELGADDYVVKPFSPRELVLRIKGILKRGKEKDKPEKEVFVSGNLRIDTGRHSVTADKKEIDLTRMEFKLLSVLMTRKGRVQTRDVLLDDVWGVESALITRTVDTHIKSLRSKLGKYGKLIETVRGIGYKFREV
jgi:two-component system, OmpR family, phosphate regulon response regulator PhoB